MTKRNSLTTSWATDVAAFVMDPEEDVDHPNGEGGPGKAARGWMSETEPEEWENYILNLRDVRIKTIAEYGRVPWDADVYYKLGSLVYHAGLTYVSRSASNKNKNPTTQTVYWSLVKFTTAADYLATTANMRADLTAHIPSGQNSHNDNIVVLGGSYKATIDNQVEFVSDAITAHSIREDNPHNDTAIGIGTIPTTGGSFTGRVNYLDNLSVGTNCELMTSMSTFVAFRSNAGAIGLGVADYSSGGRWQHIITAESYLAVNQMYNNTFVIPEPDLYFPMTSNLTALSGVGGIEFTRPTTLAYTNRNSEADTAAIDAPAFEITGLKLSVNTSLLVTAPGLLGSRDGCISYTLNNSIVVKDVQFTSEQLTYYFGTSGNIKNFRVWSQRLTPRQKLHIPR